MFTAYKAARYHREAHALLADIRKAEGMLPAAFTPSLRSAAGDAVTAAYDYLSRAREAYLKGNNVSTKLQASRTCACFANGLLANHVVGRAGRMGCRIRQANRAINEMGAVDNGDTFTALDNAAQGIVYNVAGNESAGYTTITAHSYAQAEKALARAEELLDVRGFGRKFLNLLTFALKDRGRLAA